jgi:hypothetical protein
VLGDDYLGGTDRSDARAMWYRNNITYFAQSQGVTVAAFDGGSPCAYFQYSRYGDGVAGWGEMQIDDEHRGDGATFRALVRAFLNDTDFADCAVIRGNINNRNEKSQSVFTGIGFVRSETATERGAIYVADRLAVERYLDRARR